MSPLREEWFGDNFILVSPSLVRLLGGDAVGALTLSAIQFQIDHFGMEVDGERWWSGPAEDLSALTGLSTEQVQRAVARLRGKFLVTAKHRIRGPMDQRLSYRPMWEGEQ